MLSLSTTEIHGYARRFLSSTYRQVIRGVFPTQCVTCERWLTDDPVPFFCRQCWGSIRPLRGSACPQCGSLFPSPAASSHSPSHICGDCRTRPPAFTKAWSLYPYAAPLREALGLFKYQGKYGLADSLNRLLIDALPTMDVDVIMPVPLHPAKLRTREFNQSLLLAQHVSRHLKKPLSYTNLIRTLDTAAQTTLPRSARLSNLRRAFKLRVPQAANKQRVLVIDDVFTTGTTLHECAKVLRKAGARDVYALTLARTINPGMIPDILIPISDKLHFVGM